MLLTWLWLLLKFEALHVEDLNFIRGSSPPELPAHGLHAQAQIYLHSSPRSYTLTSMVLAVSNTVCSFVSLRSRDSVFNAIRHRRDRLPESAQQDSNTISYAVALCCRFFHPLFCTTCPIILGQLGVILFRQFLHLCYWIFFNQFSRLFLIAVFLFWPVIFLWLIELLPKTHLLLKKFLKIFELNLI